MFELLIGFSIAVLIALTGVGAGVVTAPLLILFLHVPVEIAVSTALAYAAVVKLIDEWQCASRALAVSHELVTLQGAHR